jgi:DNA-binding XRE family transcriptional regulator
MLSLATPFIAYRLCKSEPNQYILWAMKPQAFLKAVGYKIRVIRTAKKLSQENLAEMANLHPTFISNLENGKLNGSILSFYRIAEALDTPLPKLFVVKAPSVTAEKKAKKKK